MNLLANVVKEEAPKVIRQLEDLIEDRKSFETDDEDCVFKADRLALEAAVKTMRKELVMP